jgi:PAS domain S-box-containing protein
MSVTTTAAPPDPHVMERTDALFEERRQHIYKRTDRMFALLMLIQWAAVVAAAILITPRTWIGATSQVHLHVWIALLLGGALTSFPVFLAWRYPGAVLTRHVIAVAQMLFSALLIHLTGGRIETHFHIFGSLAFLAFYLDWGVLLTASLVIGGDHFLRGLFWPQSIFGVFATVSWRWLEHVGWVLFEDAFLMIASRQRLDDMRIAALRQTQQEAQTALVSGTARELLASEARKAAMLEVALDCIISMDHTGHVTEWNPAAEQTFGYSAAEAIGAELGELIVPPELREAHRQGYKRYLATGEKHVLNRRIEITGMRKGGEEFPVELTITGIDLGGMPSFTAYLRDISERKRAEAALRKYADIYQYSEQAMIISSGSGQAFEMANPAYARMHGYAIEDLIGKPILDLYAPEARAEVPAHLQKALETGHHVYESFHRRKDGTVFPVVIDLTTVKDEEGNLLYRIHNVTDITERKRAEEALRESEARLAGIIGSAMDAILTVDETQRITSFNAAAERMFGYTTQEIVGQPLEQLLPARYRAAHADHVRDFAASGITGRSMDTRGVLSGRRKNGEEFPLEATISQVTVRGHRMFTAIVHDVTERVQAEEALRESGERFRQLADAMPQIVWTARPDGIVDYYNQRWYDYTGMTFEQSQDDGRASVVHPDDAPAVNQRWKESMATGKPYQVEMRLRRGGDGVYHWHLARAEPIKDEQGAVEMWFGTSTDIEDHKRAEAALKAAYDHEHRIAAALQRSLLLTPRLDEFPGLQVEPFYDPALDDALVGGDFYDLFPLDGGRAAFIVGDVSGKGLTAATHTAEVKYALRAFLRESPSPAEALCRVNRFLCGSQSLENRSFGTFVVLAVAVIDPATGQTQIAAAGAEPPLLLRADKRVDLADVAGLPLGIEPGGHYSEHTVYLAPGETLLLCTDGLTEARHGDLMLGNEGLARLVQRAAAPYRPLGEICQRIVEGTRAFAGGKLQDDACLLLVRRDIPATPPGAGGNGADGIDEDAGSLRTVVGSPL